VSQQSGATRVVYTPDGGGPSGVWWYLYGELREPYREAACTTWLEAEKAGQQEAQQRAEAAQRERSDTSLHSSGE
jgi:hypothetical protein